jgi:hypothetical protein
MRILTPEPDANPAKLCDIEGPLRRLASSPERVVAAQWQKILELAELLRADSPYPEVWGLICGDELSLHPSNSANRVTVRIRVDWQDLGPLEDSLPVMHYRIQIERPGAKLSTDAWTRSPQEAEQIIREAFGWSRWSLD